MADTDQKLAGNLAAREYEGALEQLYPLRFVERMIRVQPSRKPAIAVAQRDNPPRVLDRGLNLEPVANDCSVGQQTLPLAPPIRGDPIDVESVECLCKRLTLAQHGQP